MFDVIYLVGFLITLFFGLVGGFITYFRSGIIIEVIFSFLIASIWPLFWLFLLYMFIKNRGNVC